MLYAFASKENPFLETIFAKNYMKFCWQKQLFVKEFAFFILKIDGFFKAQRLVVDKQVRVEDNRWLASILFNNFFFILGVLNAGCGSFGNAVGR